MFRMPKGLADSYLNPWRTDETLAHMSRVDERKPPTVGGYEQLGTLNEDRKAITMTRYRSPIVMVTVATDAGEVPFQQPVSQAFTRDGNNRYYGQAFIRQADGRYRSQSLLPDHEYSFFASAPGWVPNGAQRLTLSEGGKGALNLTIRRAPAPLRVGDFAPPVIVRTMDGQVVSLGDFRGKRVLLHFFGSAPAELQTLKAVDDRFGKDDRFAIIVLAVYYADPAAMAKTAKEKQLSWPQAALRDLWYDPIAAEQLPRTGTPSRS